MICLSQHNRRFLKMCLARAMSLIVAACMASISTASEFRHLPDSTNRFYGGIVTALADDKDGRLWIASESGLVTYDGFQYKQVELKGDHDVTYISQIITRDKGNTYIISNAGVFRYLNDALVIDRLPTPVIDGLDANIENAAFIDDARLALIQGGGIMLFNEENRSLEARIKAEYLNLKGQLRRLVVSNTTLWACSSSGELIAIPLNDLYQSELAQLVANLRVYAGNIKTGCTSLHVDNQQSIWMTSQGGTQVLRHPYKVLEPADIRWGGNNMAQVASNDIAQDLEGNFWISLDHYGVLTFDGSGEGRELYSANVDDPKSLRTNQVDIIHLGKDGEFWVSLMPGGIDMLSQSRFDLRRFWYNPRVPSLLHNGILSVIDDNNDTGVLVGSERGVNTISDKFEIGELPLIDKGKAVNAPVLSFAKSISGDIWIGTWSSGIFRLNDQREFVRAFPEGDNFEGQYIWSLAIDNNSLWVGTENRSLTLVNLEDGTRREYVAKRNSVSDIPNRMIWNITAKHPQYIVIATLQGVALIDKGSNEVIPLPSAANFDNSAKYASVHYSSEEDLWLVSPLVGVVVLDSDFQIKKTFGLEDGLISLAVMGITESEKSMYVGSMDGIYEIEKSTYKVTHITTEDGLSSNLFNRNSLFFDKRTGRTFMGSSVGLNVLMRKSQDYQIPPVHPIVERFYVDGTEQPIKEFGGSEVLNATKELTVPVNTRSISLEFTAINHQFGPKIIFEHRLEGLEKNWQPSLRNRIATYNNVPPGQYEFVVRARVAGSEWGYVAEPLSFSVLAPFHETLWAKLLFSLGGSILMAILIAVIFLYRMRSRALVQAESMQQFIALMSHEVRTPLTAIIGLLDIVISKDSTSAACRDRLKIAHSNAELLLDLADDIIDANSISEGNFSLHLEELELAPFLASILLPFEQAADHKSVIMQVSIAPEVPRFIATDPTRLRQILMNFVGNAIKFTDHGSIEIVVSAGGTDETRGVRITFAVKDSGVGIANDKLGTLFERFVQETDETTRIYGGTGLGLSICKQLAELMGGGVRVESQVGVGSTFFLDLDVQEAQDEGMSINDVLPNQEFSLNILCAEDVDANREIIAHLLKPMPHRLTFAHNGVEVLEYMMKNSFDLILMDIRMPKMDGIEATKIIRSGYWLGNPIPNSNIPIVAVTANVTGSDKNQYYAVGIDDVVAKPIQVLHLSMALYAVIQKLLDQGVYLQPARQPGSGEEEFLSPIDGSVAEASLDALFGIDAREVVGAVATDDTLAKTEGGQMLSQGDGAPFAPEITLKERLRIAFVADAPQRIEEIEAALIANDFETLALVFHGVKGSAGYIEDSELMAVASQLEVAADAKDRGAITECLPQLLVQMRVYLS